MVSLYFYIPNLIGYARIILMFVAYLFAQTNPYIFFLSYFSSQFLDMFDGMAARAFNQSTKFGALLDMVTDRCSTVGLLLVLSHRYPQYTLGCHFFIWLDIFSHWAHMLATLKAGNQSHKIVKDGPWLLRYYYATKWFMVLLIFGAEGWPCTMYMLSFDYLLPPYYLLPLKLLKYVLLPLFMLKHIVNVIQFFHAANSLDEIGEKKNN